MCDWCQRFGVCNPAGNLANKCHAYAKALHYKEIEFHSNQAACLESLIAINNQLEQPEAAVGILKFAQGLQQKQQQQQVRRGDVPSSVCSVSVE